MPLDGAWTDVDEEIEQLTPPSISSTISLSANERILALEIQIAQLRQDTGVIRRAVHRVDNEMQKFVALEAQCVVSLANINANLTGLTSTVNSLSATKMYTDGVVATVIKVGAFLLGMALIIGALSGKIHFSV